MRGPLAVVFVVAALLVGLSFVRGLAISWRRSGGLAGMRAAWRTGLELGRDAERRRLAERGRREP